MVPDPNTADPNENLENRELQAYIRSAIHLLPERHRLVIVGYFLEGRPMDELGALLGVRPDSQIKDDAIAVCERVLRPSTTSRSQPSSRRDATAAVVNTPMRSSDSTRRAAPGVQSDPDRPGRSGPGITALRRRAEQKMFPLISAAQIPTSSMTLPVTLTRCWPI